MQENPTLANSVAPSRRAVLALAAGGVRNPPRMGALNASPSMSTRSRLPAPSIKRKLL
jgi:hypothetical protein